MKLNCIASNREFTFQTPTVSLKAEEWEQILTLISFFSGDKESLTLVLTSDSVEDSDSIRMFGVGKDIVALIRQFLVGRAMMDFDTLDALMSGWTEQDTTGDYSRCLS